MAGLLWQCTASQQGGSATARAPGAAEAEDGPTAAAPIVSLREGQLQGVRSNGVERFLSIPYAAPPVGPLRWRAPQPPRPWHGVRQAGEHSPRCPQLGGGGEEDCLYLEVFRPSEPRGRDALPVLFYIHGGGFKVGSAFDNDPSRIAKNTGTVVVMINYRLGQLGFLAHPALAPKTELDASSAGLYGLMDQQYALRWVHDNIAAFGGDPARVTIAGFSAGGASVCAHLASPAAAGLFTAAAIHSGGCGAVSQQEAEARGMAFAGALGCLGADAQACLRSKTAAELTAADAWTYGSGPVYGGPRLPEPPLTALTAGRTVAVPILLGGSEHEARSGRTEQYPMSESAYVAWLGETFGESAPRVLERYAPGAHADPFYAFADVVSESNTTGVGPCTNRRLARAFAGRAPTFVYEFADDEAPMPSWVASSAPKGFRLGASHGSDEAYWFDRPGDELAPFAPAQRELADQMVRYFGEFIASGSPCGSSSCAWQPFRLDAEPVLTFRPEATQMTDDWADKHQCDFWSSLGD